MLTISFFIAAFSSIVWFIYSFNYTNFLSIISSGNAEQLYQSIIIVFFPVAVIWAICLSIKSTRSEHLTNRFILRILDRLDKNAENLNALNYSLIAAEKEIKNTFVLNEFNILISDINETLADIIKRSNSVSSAQMEHLWTRTSGGERWLIAKTFIETFNFQAGFANHLLTKAQKDNLLKGSILEFHSHFKSLRQLLNTHDTQKMFFNMIEYGAMGKVFSLITPIAQELTTNKTSTPQPAAKTSSPIFSLTEEQPISFPSFLSGKKTDNQPQKEPLAEKKPISEEQIDNSLQAIRNELFNNNTTEKVKTIQDEMPAPIISNFSQTQTALEKIRTHEPLFSISKPQKSKIISLAELEEEINASPENNYDEYAYPFGKWDNEKNNK